jgi:amino acid adenylation domain-containing protein
MTEILDNAQTTPSHDGFVLPASFAQRRLWFLDRLEPNSSAYNIPLVTRLRGHLDVDALERALSTLTERHESLRTTFTVLQTVPHQLVHQPEPVSIPVVDLSAQADAEQDALALADEESARPFDLIAGPLWRGTLLKLRDDEHILALTLHHGIADAWSVGIFYRELALLYGAIIEGVDAELPELQIQYGDYASWQLQWMETGGLERQLGYWTSHLAGAPPILELPTDHPRPPLQSYRGAKADAMLPTELLNQLRELGERENATLFMTLLAAYVTLLSRYTGADDIVVASPVANRNRLELEGLIGVFANTLALRVRLGGHPTFQQLLGRVREAVLDGFSNQDLPFEKLVEELNPPRHLSHTPVAQAMFVLHSTVERPVRLPGLDRDIVQTRRGTSKFDLALFTADGPDGLRCSFEYCTDLFEEATVNRMLGHYRTLLEAIVADPTRPVTELPLLSAGEQTQLIEDWNRTDVPYSGACLHELIAEQANRVPDSVAVEYGDDRLTYAELDRRANQLAHELIARGVKRGDLVGICLERSAELVVAMLGVLKSGAAYVPVDPGYPPERQAFLLRDAQVPLLVTESQLLDATPESAASTLCIDRDWSLCERRPVVRPSIEHDPEQLAYVIYTSGSTGRPKGVEITHRSVVNLVEHMRRAPGLEEHDIVANVTTFAFDLSVPDFYLPLCHGASLVIVPREETIDGARLASRLASCGATFVQATPTTWQLLLDTGWAGDDRLKIVCGGEALPRSLANQLIVRGAALWHMYGPTETTVWSSVLRLGPGDGPPPIGGPISNTSFYVLDPGGLPVPVGVVGELYIGGHGLARGYRSREALTAEKFVEDSFATEPGRRLYRTGDLVRWRPNGTLDFVGRADHQVKLRGFRIELGEIESVLREHSAVRDAVVIPREDIAGDRRLVAYLIGEGPVPDAMDLRAFLTPRLPAYMIPSAFAVLEALPLTPGGKIDRNALPAPDGASRATHAYAPPTTELESALAAIWQRLLGVEQVGVDDDFFELGGHSLLAVQMVGAVEAELERTCTLPMLFRSGTIRRLAAEMRAGGPEADSATVLQLQARGAGPPLFCICGVHAYQELADALAPELPVFGVFLPAEQEILDQDGRGHRLSRISVEEMAAGYVKVVRERQPSGPYLLLGFCFGGIIAYEAARQLVDAGEAVGLLVMLDTKLQGSARPLAKRVAKRWLRRVAIRHTDLLPRLLLRRLIGYEAPTDTQRLELMRRQIYSDAMRKYRVRTYGGSAVLVRPDGAARGYEAGAVDRSLGWAEHIERLEVCSAPGDHLSHLKRPNVRALAEALRPRIGAARSPQGDGKIEQQRA